MSRVMNVGIVTSACPTDENSTYVVEQQCSDDDHDDDRRRERDDEEIIQPQQQQQQQNQHDSSHGCESSVSLPVDSITAASPTKQTEANQMTSKKYGHDIQRMKILIFIVVAMSITGAILVYFYTRCSQNVQFSDQFNNDANKVLGSIGGTMERALGALDSLSTTIVSIARYSNQTFPYVTIPEFGLHVIKSMEMTRGLCTYFNPVITFQERNSWENYSSNNNTNLPKVVNFSMQLQNKWPHFYGPKNNYTRVESNTIYSDDGPIPYDQHRSGLLDVYLPEWHVFPLVMTSYGPAGWDWYSMQYPEGITKMLTTQQPVLSQPMMIPRPDNPDAIKEADHWCEFYRDYIAPDENCLEPLSQWYYPIIDSLDLYDTDLVTNVSQVKASLIVEFYWRHLLRDILPESSKGIVVVFENSCTLDTPFTYQLDGPKAIYLGGGDLHDPDYDSHEIQSTMFDLQTYLLEQSLYSGIPLDQTGCTFTFRVYPSDTALEKYRTNDGIIFSISAVLFILLPFVGFLAYDRKMGKQQKFIISKASRSNAIVSSLFPSQVRDRLLEMDNPDSVKTTNAVSFVSSRHVSSNPIAELYPDTTILFADIAGFTVWSSARDPYQVFTLLENIFGALDRIARRLRVFKVETVGDCYVAVAGLPEPRRDHAVVMTRMAYLIVKEMANLTYALEKYLGPGTSELQMRAGLNSGPTTAGILRGDKSRFQLFGDTVNTAARMESNSRPGWIMCSQKTADLLVAAGKGHWITPRSDLVDAKGKGKMQCYWCHPKSDLDLSLHRTPSQSDGSVDFPRLSTSRSLSETISFVDQNRIKKNDKRLIGWMVQTFEEMLHRIIISRKPGDVCRLSSKPAYMNAMNSVQPRDELIESVWLSHQQNRVEATLATSPTNVRKARNANERLAVELSESIKSQLEMYITEIASLYKNDNPFHNFQHACHVVMSTRKLLSRVVQSGQHAITDNACCITCDPIAQFAIVFSALVHDVGHPGISNVQLSKEQTPTALKYQNKSISEQNSIVVAWDLLMQPQYNHLCHAIMSSECECKRFRQLLINSVMATDLFDDELKSFRENRWNKAFFPDRNNTQLDSTESSLQPIPSESSIANDGLENRLRTTIVIELIIQASDVSHTMQHWKVYQKWNLRLLHEMYIAYVNGRADNDPTIQWYKGELWFFDNYIIPLAHKLKTCGVFGVSCDEFLDYAIENRLEWSHKGQDIVNNYIQRIKNKQNKVSTDPQDPEYSAEASSDSFPYDRTMNGEDDNNHDRVHDDFFIAAFQYSERSISSSQL